MVEENAENQIQLGVRSGGIAIITFNRLKALNVLMRDMLTRLCQAGRAFPGIGSEACRQSHNSHRSKESF
jgi:hypothetical protein